MTNGTEKYVELVAFLGKLYDFLNQKLFYGELVKPVITLINKDGTMGRSYRSVGSASMIVSEALKRNGIYTKRRLQKKKY